MVKIMADSAAFLSPEEGAAKGVYICPMSVTVDDKTYTEYSEIDSTRLMRLVEGDFIPQSSQPSVGVFLDGYRELAGNEIIVITMANGLSETYTNACIARDQTENKDDITVINSATFASAERYLVTRAAKMAAADASRDEIIAMLEEVMPSVNSFLIPEKNDYVHRSGRLITMDVPLARLLRATAVFEQTEKGTRLAFHAIHRKEEGIARDIVQTLKGHGLGTGDGEGWIVSFSHANNPKRVRVIRTAVREAFPNANIEMCNLSPAFIAQGGPQCVIVQAVHKCHEDD